MPVVVQQKDMDRVGVEPATSAHFILVQSDVDGKLVQIPPSSFFCAYPVAFCTFKRIIEKKASQTSKKQKKCVASFGLIRLAEWSWSCFKDQVEWRLGCPSEL
jgi:hypothetical protein